MLCVNAQKTQSLIIFDFIKQALVVEHSQQVFCFITFMHRPFTESQFDSMRQLIPDGEFIVLDRLPLNTHGDVDVEALSDEVNLIRTQDVSDLIRNARIINKFELKRTYTPRRVAWTPSFHSAEHKSHQSKLCSAKMAYVQGPLLESLDTEITDLADALFQTARRYPHKKMIAIESDGIESSLTYQKLLENARKITSYLSLKLPPGAQTVILSFEEYVPFFSSLWGAVLERIAFISITLPNACQRISAHSEKFYNTWQLLDKPYILTTKKQASVFKQLQALYPKTVFHLLFYEEAMGLPDTIQQPSLFPQPISSNSIVFYQLTSGSTGIPKCIIETHHNIIAHIRNTARLNHHVSEDVSLNWISFDHVVPIITYHFRDIVLGCQQVHLATSLIINQPLKWLDYIKHYHITTTWSPHFGYKLLVDAIDKHDQPLPAIPSLRYFMNAGEQVTAPVLRQLAQQLKKNNLSSQIIQPAFGMAETATCVTYNNAFDIQNSIVTIQSASFESDLHLAQHHEFGLEFVDLGSPIPNCAIRIVDTNKKIVAELTVGMLEIKGPMLSAGYFRNDSANSAFQADGWLQTGDLGFIYDSRLFITGREKEIIIIRGKNYFCYEIEEAIAQVSGVKNTFVAATSCLNALHATEELIIFYVLKPHTTVTQSALHTKIREVIFDGFGLQIAHLIDLPISAFPKTSSGKIQRTLLKNQFQQGEFDWKINSVAHSATPVNCHTLEWIRKNIDLGSVTNAVDQTCMVALHPASRLNYQAQSLFRIIEWDPTHTTSPAGFPIFIITDLYWASDDTWDATYVLAVAQCLTLLAKLPSPPKHIMILTKACAKTHNDFINKGYQQGWIQGFVRSFKKEMALPNIVIVDLEGQSVFIDYSCLEQELSGTLKDNFIAYRQKNRYIQSWKMQTLPTIQPLNHTCLSQQGSCLIIGGAGGIGSKLLPHLIKRYGHHMIVTSTQDALVARRRSRWDSAILEHITFLQLDLSLENPDFSVFVPYQNSIHTVIFLAGISQYSPAQDFTQEQIHRHFSPKGRGLKAVLTYFQQQQLSPHYLVFSSIMGVVGTAQYGLYAAANSLCESVCDYLSTSHNLLLQYIAWCPWLATGMAEAFDYTTLATSGGFQALEADMALTYFDHIRQSPLPHAYLGLQLEKLRLFSQNLYDEHFVIHLNDTAKSPKVSVLATLHALDINDITHKPVKMLYQSVVKKRTQRSKLDHLPSIYLEDIWCQRLHIATFDKTKHFFELGGDSLSAIHLLMDIAEVFGVLLTMHDLLTCQHFTALVARIETQASYRKAQNPSPYPESGAFLLSPDQQRLWYLVSQGQNTTYLVYKLYEVSYGLEPLILEAAITDVLKHYPTLRTRFFEHEGSTYQEAYDYSVKDVFYQHAYAGTHDLFAALQTIIESPFELYEKKPLTRIHLFSSPSAETFLLLTIHHLICDEWTIKQLFKQLSECYNNRLFKKETLLKPEILSFQQFSQQQHQQSITPTQAFLKQIVANHVITLPYQQVGTETSQAGILLLKPLDKLLFSKLHSLAQQHRVSPAILMHGLFSVVLHLYSNQTELNIGIPITYRDNPGLRHSMGFFINTSIIGSRLRQECRMEEHIHQIKKNYLLAQLNRQVPLSKVLKHFQDVSRSNQHNPLFQVMFVYEDFINEFSMQGLRVTEKTIHNRTAKFHLNLMVRFPKKSEPELALEFHKGLIHPDTAQCILDKMVDVIAGYVKQPCAPVSSFLHLLPIEQAIVDKVNTPHQTFPIKTLYELVSPLPQSFEICYETNSLAGHTLQQNISYFMEQICAQKQSKATIIGVYLTQKHEQIIALLSIVSLGLTYLPLNPEDPIERITKICLRSPKINLLTDSKEIQGVASLYNKIIKIHEVGTCHPSKPVRVTPPTPSDLAYIIFTSGSTGQPKGVMIQHQSAYNTLYDMITRFGLTQKDVFLMLSKISFDLSVFDLFASAMLGARLVIPRDQAIFSPAYLLEVLSQHQVTVWNSTPGLMRVYLDFMKNNPSHKSLKAPSSLKCIFLSGDWISLELARDIQAFFPKAKLVALGGATEASIWSNYFEVSTLHESWASIPYGRALTNQHLYVLNHALDFCPCHVAGRLFIGGSGVAKGYYKNPRLTASKFINHPRLGRIYDTGDRAKVTADGYVFILGREDEQIKIRGFRVEPKEIEQTIQQSGFILQTKVIAIGELHQKNLVAYLVGGSKARDHALSAYLKTHLPAYMIPGRLIHLSHFPLTRNGKIDTQALLDQLNLDSLDTPHELSAKDKHLDMIKHVFKKILHLNQSIHHDDSFFSLGGDSITASYVIFELNKQLKSQLLIEDLFNHPTPKALKRCIQGDTQNEHASLPVPLHLNLSDHVLSNNQMRLIFVQNQTPSATVAYNMTLFYKMKGDFDKARFLSACRDVLLGYKILNVRILQGEKIEFEQRYDVQHDIDHQDLDLTTLVYSESAKVDLAKQILVNASKMPFDLEKNKKYHLTLVQTDDKTYYVLFMFHHLIADGESIKLLFASIQKIYPKGKSQAQEHEPSQLDYFDYVTWFHQFITTKAYQKQFTYWQHKMIELTHLQKRYPVNHLPHSHSPSFIGKKQIFTVEYSHYRPIKQQIIKQASSEFIYWLTQFKWSLYQQFKHQISIICTTVAARPYGFENSIGFFANTLPIITVFDPDESIHALHHKVRQATLELLDNQLIPFEKIVHLKRDADHSPSLTHSHQSAFQIAFVYLQELYLLDNTTNLEIERLYLDNQTSKFDLTLYVHEGPQHLCFEFEYNPNIFSGEIINQCMWHLKKTMGIVEERQPIGAE